VPRPGFPTSLRQFQRQFADEEPCQQYLARCRWPEGFRCPRCDHGRAFALVAQRRWQCAACRYQVSVTAGTVLHNTKQPLTVWFWAAYLMTTDKRGLSALLLQRQLALSRYETAWMMLHKLRRAMVNRAREPLRGEVEIDEVWIGAPQPGLRGSRQLKGRKAALVLAAVERRGKASGRLRLEVIPDFSGATMLDFARRNIATGATIYSDKLTGFAGFTKAGYGHVAGKQPLRTELRKGTRSAVPLADRAIGNLQQWLVGTHHGVSRVHLQVYLDEFVFRHNRRRQPMAAFQTLLGLGSGREPTTYALIRGAKDRRERSLQDDPPPVGVS
jgi:transposase-like protein